MIIVSKIKSTIDYAQFYKDLIKLDGFKPWLRSFKDLHSSLNSETNINYKQLRILDCILVIAIRTEVLIRSICQERHNLIDFSFKKLFHKLMVKLTDNNLDYNITKTLCEIHQKWDVSCKDFNELDTNDDIFQEIRVIPKPNNWNELMLYNLKNILKFVTSRNYFAHYSFKDDEINSPKSELATEILTSCIESIVIIQGYTEI